MAIGRRKPEQQKMWVNQHQLPKGQGHPFYARLNDLLAKDEFDSWAEDLCAPSFASKGRPSIPPGVYFRMLFIGYLEGFASDRAFAWNCQDRLSLRAFLGIPFHESTPDPIPASASSGSGCPWRSTGRHSSASWPSSTSRG